MKALCGQLVICPLPRPTASARESIDETGITTLRNNKGRFGEYGKTIGAGNGDQCLSFDERDGKMGASSLAARNPAMVYLHSPPPTQPLHSSEDPLFFSSSL
jgi:hypothetical protein